MHCPHNGLDSTLSLPTYNPDKPDLLGIFMVGDYRLAQALEGDTVESSLGNVNFNRNQLTRSYREQLEKSSLHEHERAEFFADLTRGLQGYTYFED